MNESSFTGCSALWLGEPAEAGIRRRKASHPPGFLHMWDPAGAANLLAQKEGFSPLPVVYPEEAGRLKAGRMVEFIQSAMGSEGSSGAFSPSRGEVRRIKVTDGPATCVLVCVGGREGMGVPGFDDSDRREVADGL